MITATESETLRATIHTPSPTPDHHHDGCQCDPCRERGVGQLIALLRESLIDAQQPSADVKGFV